MEAKRALDTSLLSPPLLSTRCHLVAAYEDFTCGTVVKATCSSLRATVSQKVPCDYTLWRFDLLELPEAFWMAADDARAATVVLISTYGTHPIPGQTRRWLETFIAERDCPAAAIVGLFGGLEEIPISMPAYQNLAELAENASLAFFTQTFHVPSFERLLPKQVTEPRAHDLIAKNFFPGQGSREWGINE